MQKSGISDKTGKSYINGISVTNSTITVTEATSLNFTIGGPITTTVQGSEEALISFNLDAVKSREALGLGTAALINTGTASGQIPVLDARGKLPESVIGDIALYDKFDIASADNINDIVIFINGITTGITPKQGDMIFVLGGNVQGTYWITVTKTPGTYTADDISGITTPSGTISSITFLGTNYTPVNGIITLPANIGWSSLTGIPAASVSASGIVKLNDNTNSTSTTEAATANAVKKVQDFASTKISGIWFKTNQGLTSERNSFTIFGTGPIYIVGSDAGDKSLISVNLDTARVKDSLNIQSIAPAGPYPPTIPETYGTGAAPELLGKLDRSFMPRNIIGFTSSSSLPPVNPPSDFIQGFAFTAQDNNGEETPGFSVSVFEKYYSTGEIWKGINYFLNSSLTATSGPDPVIPATGADGKLDASFIPDSVSGGIGIVNSSNPGTTLTAKTLRIGALDGLGVSIAPLGPNSSEINVFYGLEETSFKSYLTNTIGIKTAAYQNTGTTNGTIPLIGANDKLPASIIPDEIGGNFSSFTINNGYEATQSISSNPNQIKIWNSPFFIGPHEATDLVNELYLNNEGEVTLSQRFTDRAALRYITCVEDSGNYRFTTYYCGPLLIFESFSAYTKGPFLKNSTNFNYTGTHPGELSNNAYTKIQIDPYFALARSNYIINNTTSGSLIDIYTDLLTRKYYFRPSSLSSTNTLIVNLYIDKITLQNYHIDNTLILDPRNLSVAPQNIQILLPNETTGNYKLFIDQGDVGTLTNTHLYNISIGIIRPTESPALIMVKYSQFVPV